MRVHPDRLEIQLSKMEKALALRREPVVITRKGIRAATITQDPWIWLRGIRAPGIHVPLNLAVGTWKFHGGKDFMLVKRSRTSVVIDVEGGEFERVIISTALAGELVHALRLAGDDQTDHATVFDTGSTND